MRTIVVCGGRSYNDAAKIEEVLDGLWTEEPFRLVQGGASGADQLAQEWANFKSTYGRCPVDSITYRADWRTFGSRAGPLRNIKMLETEKPSLVVAFPGGVGTYDCVRRAKSMHIPVMEIGW